MRYLSMLGEISLNNGDGFVHQLLMILLIGICVGIVYAMGWWVLKKLPVPPLAMTLWNGLFILVGGIVVINFLLGLAGHPLIRW